LLAQATAPPRGHKRALNCASAALKNSEGPLRARCPHPSAHQAHAAAMAAPPPPPPRFGAPVPVPAREQNELELVPMRAAVVEPCAAGPLVKALFAAAPLDAALGHVKRVRRAADGAALHVLLGPCDESAGGAEDPVEGAEGEPLAAALAALPPAAAAAVAAAARGVVAARVPRFAPQTKADRDAWSAAHWPVSLRAPDPAAAAAAAPPGGAEAAAMRRHMARAWALARAAAAGGGGFNACVVVDPASGAVQGEAGDGAAAHPLRHAVIAAVGAVADAQRARWPDAAPGAAEPPKRRRLLEGEDEGAAVLEGEDEDGGAARKDNPGALAERPYLCTGFDAYVVAEPCLMCAMALVHSRARRVVFCAPDAARGALGGSGRRLHAERSLNHHYAVYRLPLLADGEEEGGGGEEGGGAGGKRGEEEEEG
jgi:tRNA-specific adenosine deaminase 3